MKTNRKDFCVILAFVLSIFTLTGCSSSLSIPFTEITWENSLEDVEELEGDVLETYDSTYGGTTYSYEKSYKDIDGVVKYMLDEDGKIVCIAWQCTLDSQEELDDIYETILDETTDQYGECDFTPPNYNSKANVWYLDNGNISIFTVSASTAYTLQYTFTHPDVAERSDK